LGDSGFLLSYIFLGSRKHLIQKMFLDRSRPLYRAAGHYPLGSIGTEHWLPFIGRKFREGEKVIAEDAIKGICKLTEGHPFYTQHLCHALWELCEPGEAVTDSLIEAAMKVLLDRESYAYTALWESLALKPEAIVKRPRFGTRWSQTVRRCFCQAARPGIPVEFAAGGRESTQSGSFSGSGSDKDSYNNRLHDG
jgi:hypothetical protein